DTWADVGTGTDPNPASTSKPLSYQISELHLCADVAGQGVDALRRGGFVYRGGRAVWAADGWPPPRLGGGGARGGVGGARGGGHWWSCTSGTAKRRAFPSPRPHPMPAPCTTSHARSATRAAISSGSLICGGARAGTKC